MSASTIIMDEYLRQLARQETAIDLVRDRSARLVSALGVIVGLFAVASKGHNEPMQVVARLGAYSVLAIIVFVFVYIEWPRSMRCKSI